MEHTRASSPGRYSKELRRAALPEVLHVEDIALAMRVSTSAARRAIKRGECGPYTHLGRRIVVLREEFLAALAGRQERPERPEALPKPPEPPEWAKRLLGRQRGRKGGAR